MTATSMHIGPVGPWNEDDRVWFSANPDALWRIRALFPLEAWSHATLAGNAAPPAAAAMLVLRMRPGERVRVLVASADPPRDAHELLDCWDPGRGAWIRIAIADLLAQALAAGEALAPSIAADNCGVCGRRARVGEIQAQIVARPGVAPTYACPGCAKNVPVGSTVVGLSMYLDRWHVDNPPERWQPPMQKQWRKFLRLHASQGQRPS